MYKVYTALQNMECILFMLTTVAYRCCADHSILMTIPLITAPADNSCYTAVLRLLRWCEQSFVDCYGSRSCQSSI